MAAPSLETSRRPANPGDRRCKAHELALAATPRLQLDLALAKALWADDDLMRRADQIHRGEFRAGPVVAVVQQHVDARLFERGANLVAGAVAGGVADLEIDEPDLEWRNRLRPDRAGLVVIRLDQGGREPGRADSV